MFNIFRKLFINGEWEIAYCKKEDFKIDGVTNYNIISNTKDGWYADPIPYTDDTGSYLFVEAYSNSTQKGDIGVFYINDESADKWEYTKIIDESYHMSYPYVFVINNEYYLVPESNEIKKVIVYKADKYPLQWNRYKELDLDGAYVDTSVVYDGISNQLKIITYKKEKNSNHLKIYNLEEDFTLTNEEDFIDFDKKKRGAGKITIHNEKLIRPSQLCSEDYGKYVLINEIVNDKLGYSEVELGKYTIDNCEFIGASKKNIKKVHTLSIDDKYVFIDFYREFFDVLRIPKILKRRIYEKRRSKENFISDNKRV